MATAKKNVCPECGGTIGADGRCKSCGYKMGSDSSSNSKPPFPPKKSPSKGKAPAKKGGKVPPQFQKRGY